MGRVAPEGESRYNMRTTRMKDTSGRRSIAVLTTGRQDWAALRSICKVLASDKGFRLQLLVGGMHCARQFGSSQTFIEEDSFTPAALLPWIPETGELPAHDQAGSALRMVGDALLRLKPHALLLVGDRYEVAAAAIASTLACVPLVHLHGGEETEGSFDNLFRNAITKLSHLHLVSHPEHARRVLAMGEDASTVHVVGAPSLDNLHRDDLATKDELERYLKVRLEAPIVIVTVHPATHGEDAGELVSSICNAMDKVDVTYVITLPNTDPRHEVISTALRDAAKKSKRVAVEVLGERRYWGLMKITDAMLGNSSSALIEAPMLGLPAVNVGSRQQGRVRGGNIIDTPVETEAIIRALRMALTAAFRRKATRSPSPFGDGKSGEKIVELLRGWQPPCPPRKTLITHG